MTISSSQHGVRLKHSKSSPSFVFCYLKKPKLIDSILILEFLSYQTNYFDKIYWIQTAQKNVWRAIWTIYNGQQNFRNIFVGYSIYLYQMSITIMGQSIYTKYESFHNIVMTYAFIYFDFLQFNCILPWIWNV